jgi:hypothetical protein
LKSFNVRSAQVLDIVTGTINCFTLAFQDHLLATSNAYTLCSLKLVIVLSSQVFRLLISIIVFLTDISLEIISSDQSIEAHVDNTSQLDSEIIFVVYSLSAASLIFNTTANLTFLLSLVAFLILLDLTAILIFFSSLALIVSFKFSNLAIQLIILVSTVFHQLY